MQNNDSDSPSTGESEIPWGGSQFPATGSQYPGSGSQFPATGSQYPGSGSQFPATGSQYPGSGSQYPQYPQYPGSGSQYPAGGGRGYPPPPPPWGPSTPDPSMYGGWGYPPQPWAYHGYPPPQRYGRPASPFGDYRPNMDAVNNPIDTTSSAPLPQNLGDFDDFTFEQMANTASQWENPTPEPRRPSGRAGGKDGGRVRRGGRAGGPVHYSADESVALAKAWFTISEDAIVGTDQTDGSFWTRIAAAYDQFKPTNAPSRTGDHLRKKWSRIQAAVSRFAGIYENNHRLVESGRSEEDIKKLSYEMHREGGNYPKFTYWEAFLILKESSKFRALCEEVSEAPPKRTRTGASGQYSTSSGAGSPSVGFSEDREEEPQPTLTRRRRPLGQQSSIREARANPSGSRASSASGPSAGMSAIGPSASTPPADEKPSRSMLSKNLELAQLTKLLEIEEKMITTTNPRLKRMYEASSARLRMQLEMVDLDAEPAAAGEEDVPEDSDECND